MTRGRIKRVLSLNLLRVSGLALFSFVLLSENALAQATSENPELPNGYGAALLQGVVSLLAVCLLAWLVLRVLGKSGFGRGDGQRMRVVDRLSLDARNQLYLVEIEGQRYLLSASGQSAPRLIEALGPSAQALGPSAQALGPSAQEVPSAPDASGATGLAAPSAKGKLSFKDVLFRSGNKKTPDKKPDVVLLEDE